MLPERLHRDESGLALVYAIFAVLILGGLAVLFVARATNEARFTGISRDRETAIHVAEAGAEEYIAPINSEGHTFASRVLTLGDDPATVTVETNAPMPYDPGGLTGEALEQWEIAWALDIVAKNPGLLESTGEGEAFGIRPANAAGTDAEMLIFGLGFVPSYNAWVTGADRAELRVVKMSINRNFLQPRHALLLDGDLTFGGNASILAPGCSGGSGTCNADIHVNGDVDVTGSAHTIEGTVTAEGTITGSPNTVPAGQSFAGEENVELPELAARDFYGRETTLNVDPTTGAQVDAYDLCPDGTVREPTVGGIPCAAGATQIWPVSGGSSTNFRGWEWRSSQKEWDGKNLQSGFYYVYGADAQINGTDGTVAASVLVEADPADLTRTGSLQITGDPEMVSALPDVLFIVDHDIKMKGSSGGGSGATCDPLLGTCDLQQYTGFIWAGEQLDVSGSVSLAGAIMAQDETDDHGLVKRNTAGINGSMTLDFDPDLKIDTSGIVTIEYWNELD